MNGEAETTRELRRVTRRLAALEQRRSVIVAERDRLIRRALEQGESLRGVAADADLSKSMVAIVRDGVTKS